MQFLWALLLAATGAASFNDAPEDLAGRPGGDAHRRSPSAVRVSSAIPGLRISRASMVPAAVPRQEVEGDCHDHLTVATTNVGRDIVRRGWHVISEARVGDHVAIAYVRGLLLGTSSICFAVNGHVAIADRTGVVAIISAARNDPSNGEGPMGEVHGDLIGEVHQAPGSGNFRITDGTAAAPPIADVRFDAGGVQVLPVASQDAICHGRAWVPNVYGRTMLSASRTLRRLGWRPVNARLGLQDCSGTGIGYCGYRYRRGRLSLDFTTADDDHHIIDYAPHC